jgi:hypothetical protein
MSLQTFLDVRVRATQTAAIDLVTKSAAMDHLFSDELADGTSSGQADVCFSDRRTIGSSSSEALDLIGGSLLDNLGVTFAPARVKLIFVSASTTNDVHLNVIRETNGVPFFGSSGDKIQVHPGGAFLAHNPTAAGWGVVLTTQDLIGFTNTGPGTVTYDVVVIGGSA